MTTYVMRHSYRFDKGNETWNEKSGEYIYDTPLSPHGMRQAIERGEQLKDKGIKQIYTSPFTRAAQTAQLVACILDLPIIIDARLSEILRRRWFKNGINIQPRHFHYPSIVSVNKWFDEIPYPEGHPGVIARTKNFVEEEDVEDCLLVSHGTTCRRLIQALIPGTKLGMPRCSQVLEVKDGVFRPWPL